MAKNNISAGGVNVSFGANLSGLEQGITRAKQIVKAGADDMSRTAKVGFTATGTTAVTGSQDLGPATAAMLKPGRVASEVEAITSRAANAAEKDSIHRAAVAAYQQQTGMTVRDRDQKNFERQYAKQKADDLVNRRATAAVAGMSDAPSMEAIEDAARHERRMGKKIAAADAAANAGNDAAGNLLYPGAVAAVAALYYLAKGAVDAALDMRRAGAIYDYTAARLGGVAGRQSAGGLGFENAQLEADLRVAAAQNLVARSQAHANAPFGFVHGWMYPDELTNAQIALQERTGEASVTGGALSALSGLRIRNAATRGGLVRSPLESLAQAQAEELRPLLIAQARYPGNQTNNDAIAQMKGAHINEFMIQEMKWNTQLFGLKTAGNIESLRGMGLTAEFKGNNRQALAAEFAGLRLSDQAEEEAAVAANPAAESLIRRAFRGRAANRKLEGRERLRQLIENPAEASVMSPSEAAGPFISRTENMEDETREFFEMVEGMLTRVIDKLGLN